jgi:predicted acetyltransferase
MTDIPIEIGPLTADDADAVIAVDEAAFGIDLTPEKAGGVKTRFEWDRMLGAWDGSLLVGTCGAFSFQMTVPERRTVPVAAVTWVSVLPTHRRRGILRRFMTRQLAEIHARGEAVAALWASEGAIYGRFGYGAASRSVALHLSRGVVLSGPPTDADLRLELLRPSDALPLTEPIYADVAARRPGMMERSRPEWQALATLDQPSTRDGASAQRVVVASDSTGPRAYARFAVTPGHGRDGEVRVFEVSARDASSESAIWRFLTDLDLTAKIRVASRPVDDPLLHRIPDLHAGQVRLEDNLFVRLVDLPKALAARSFAAPLDLVVNVEDPVCPWNARRWRLEAGPDGLRCVHARAGASADLTMSATDLGAVYLGGVSVSPLVAAGRVHEHRPGAAAAMTTAFGSDIAPWCAWIF